MREWTEQEEQEIIERAKTGDPEANYELSLWALHRGEEEPDEPRWNRLAAKCLVKAAQAGYAPAQEQMGALLGQGGQTPAARENAAPKAAPADKPVSTHNARQSRRAAAHRTTARLPQQQEDRDESEDEDDDGFDVEQVSWDDGEDDPAPSKGRRRGGVRKADSNGDGEGRSKWSDIQWRRMELICIGVCALLMVFIAVILLTGRKGGDSGGNTPSAIPPAAEAVPAADTPSGAAAGANDAYPDQATKDAVMASDLDIMPAEEDYMTSPTTATVSVSSVSLRLRKGPNTTYHEITDMPNGTVVQVLAAKNDWDLVQYESDEGTIYGWCSSGYLILTSGTAAGPAPTATPGGSEG